MSLKKVRIKPAKDKSIVRKHPWVFSGAIKEIENGVAEGDWVEVIANKGRTLGFGHYANGSIAVEPMIDVKHIADAVRYIAALPLSANVLNMTVMATNMPFVGRG